MKDTQYNLRNFVSIELAERLEKQNVSIRDADECDCAWVAKHMRKADITEVFRASGWGPLEALDHALEVSARCMSLVVDDAAIAIFGISSSTVGRFGHEGEYGAIWMLGTDQLVKKQKIMMQLAKPLIVVLSEGYVAIGNYVDSENTVHIAWLKRMGFSFIDVVDNFGPTGDCKFLQFVRLDPNIFPEDGGLF